MSVDHEDEVRSIMRSVVAPRTALNYALRNACLVLYLFEKRDDFEDMLEPWYLDQMEGLDEEKRKIATKNICLDMEASLNNCPLILGCLTFKIFSEFVAGKKSGSKMLSKSTYEGYRSALRHMFRSSRYEMEKMFEKNLSLFMSGLVRKVSNVGCYEILLQNVTQCVCVMHR